MCNLAKMLSSFSDQKERCSSDIKELARVKDEMKRLAERNSAVRKPLKQKQRELEDRIMGFMKQTGHTGLKHEDKILELHSRTRTSTLTLKRVRESVTSYFSGGNEDVGEKLMQHILDSLEKTEMESLRWKKARKSDGAGPAQTTASAPADAFEPPDVGSDNDSDEGGQEQQQGSLF